jgi:hypothetical protein
MIGINETRCESRTIDLFSSPNHAMAFTDSWRIGSGYSHPLPRLHSKNGPLLWAMSHIQHPNLSGTSTELMIPHGLQCYQALCGIGARLPRSPRMGSTERRLVHTPSVKPPCRVTDKLPHSYSLAVVCTKIGTSLPCSVTTAAVTP